MLPKNISDLLDKGLVASFDQMPIFLMNRLLWLVQKNPRLADKWGYSIRRLHYYEPLPDFSAITHEQIMKRRYSNCIDWDFKSQINLVKRLASYQPELQNFAEQANQFNFFNDSYLELDAAIYYCLIRQIKPAKVIEIGSGYSSQIAAIALAMNRQDGSMGKLICIEPYPQPKLIESNLEFELIAEKVESINLDVFAQLTAGDILFIDSTHTVKFGSDVCREILEILPTIPDGVWIHFHDIFFPYDYPPKWLIEDRRAWNEQYMLEAFLAYNNKFEVVLANHWLALDYPQEAAKVWPGVLNWENASHRCGGFWLRKK